LSTIIVSSICDVNSDYPSINSLSAGARIDNYSTATRNIALKGGFLKNTAGACTNVLRTSGVSTARVPTSYEKTVFSQSYPALDPAKYAVAAVAVQSTSAAPVSVKLDIEIDQSGLSPIFYNTAIDFNLADPLQ
jgi:hypothetical protein